MMRQQETIAAAARDRRSLLRRTSSIASRASQADSSRNDAGKLWLTIAVVVSSILVVYTSSYLIIEYCLFGGQHTSFTALDPATACTKSLLDAEFDLIEWDRYEEWFDDETILELPEVGVYTGTQGIREYVQIVASKYFGGDSRYIYGPDVRPIRNARKDECSMLVTFGLRSSMNPEYTRGGILERGVGAKIYYAADPFRVDKIYIYYSLPYQSHVFGTYLSDDRVRDDICTMMETKCAEVYQQNNLTQQLCHERWDALPMHEDGRTDGNSRGCRIVHGSMAALNTKHCPHLSFVPMEDTNGKIKCQESGMRSPLDIFTKWELDTITDAAAEHGLPADTMYRELDVSPSAHGLVSDDAEYQLSVTGSFFSSNASDTNYIIFYGFVLWATIVLTGLGLEFFSYLLLIKGNWNEQMENRWRFVQFLFPLFATTSVGMAHSGSFWAIPIITLTLYKFGFPETILYLYSGLFDGSMSKAERIKDTIDGIGTVIHHSSAALYIAMVLVKVIPSSRTSIEVVVPVLVQHWFVLLRYGYRWAYVVIETIIEAWFEWTVLSLLEVVASEHWVAGIVAASMLFSHWLYFVAGAIGLLSSASPAAGTEGTSENNSKLQRLRTMRDLNAVGSLDVYESEDELSTSEEDWLVPSAADMTVVDSASSVELGSSSAPQPHRRRISFSDEVVELQQKEGPEEKNDDLR